MGSPWKMFTKDQGQELIDGTTSTWTSINNVVGRKFTSKTDSSKYIFLPAGGYWYNANHYDTGTYGYNWTTTNGKINWAHSLIFNSSNLYIYKFGSVYEYGLSIRGIK